MTSDITETETEQGKWHEVLATLFDNFHRLESNTAQRRRRPRSTGTPADKITQYRNHGRTAPSIPKTEPVRYTPRLSSGWTCTHEQRCCAQVVEGLIKRLTWWEITDTTLDPTKSASSRHQVVNLDICTRRRGEQPRNVVTAAQSFQVYVTMCLCCKMLSGGGGARPFADKFWYRSQP